MHKKKKMFNNLINIKQKCKIFIMKLKLSFYFLELKNINNINIDSLDRINNIFTTQLS